MQNSMNFVVTQNLQHDIHHNYKLKVHNGLLKRGLTNGNAQILQSECKDYLNELKNFDNLMPNHVMLGKDTTHWDECWSSLWVHAFLIHQMTPQNGSLTLTKNMRAVPCPPFFAVIDFNEKKFVIAQDNHV